MKQNITKRRKKKLPKKIKNLVKKKQPPNIVRYHNCKNINNEVFINDLNECFTENTEFLSFDYFKRTTDKTLAKYAPIKKGYVRANQASFVNKNINKEIMKRSCLRNKFLSTKSNIDRKTYSKQSNICVTLIRQEKENFYSKLINTWDITDNKTFWKMVKHFFADKI